MPRVCSSDAAKISFIEPDTWLTDVTISPIDKLTCSTRSLPCFTRKIVDSMSSFISFAASALRCAKLRTSLATTEKPRPCSPALAASTAALSANILV